MSLKEQAHIFLSGPPTPRRIWHWRSLRVRVSDLGTAVEFYPGKTETPVVTRSWRIQ